MNSASAILQREIEQNGAISLARFMEQALYCPEFGYYERQRTIGKRGDFFTSVSVGGLFGELLAAQFKIQNAKLNFQEHGQTPRIIEAGAHDGQLAGDILSGLLKHDRRLSETAEYWILEPSPKRRSWQKATLAAFGGRVKWFGGWEEIEPGGVSGMIFANELLDAFPAHRISWDASKGEWFEWGVGRIGGRFVWKRLPEVAFPREHLPRCAPELLAILPDGFTTEICPAAGQWWRRAAQRLRRGILMTVDYGLTDLEFFRPERNRGTLRAYRQHRIAASALDHPGEQDLTAHVNFSALQHAGQDEGLATEGPMSQARFLTQIARTLWNASEFEGWSSEQVRQFQTLTHPEHMGRAFSVLVQERE